MERPDLIDNRYLVLFKFIVTAVFIVFLTGCSAYKHAPVRDIVGPVPEFHQVRSGETLYSIAWKYGKDYREIARLNSITAPYKIKTGQRIRIGGMISFRKTREMIAPQAKHNAPQSRPIFTAQKPNNNDWRTRSIKTWLWPVSGQVISHYASRGGMNKGIDIAAKPGAPVRATAAGKVVYSGSGLRGYGELVIIKHNEEFLSAYAHNKKLFVHEGEEVSPGQIIAQVGNSDAKRVLLHFEIRRAGKPVDPLKYLSKTN